MLLLSTLFRDPELTSSCSLLRTQPRIPAAVLTLTSSSTRVTQQQRAVHSPRPEPGPSSPCLLTPASLPLLMLLLLLLLLAVLLQVELLSWEPLLLELRRARPSVGVAV